MDTICVCLSVLQSQRGSTHYHSAFREVGDSFYIHTLMDLSAFLSILWGEDACCAFVSSHNSAKVSWKGHFSLVRNENPFREDSLPFHNLYIRNPIGLTHCAAESLLNPYSMQWMPLINGFGRVLSNHLVTPIAHDSWVRTGSNYQSSKTCCSWAVCACAYM